LIDGSGVLNKSAMLLCACSLIATDFDRLPDVRIPGRNAPLVAEKVGSDTDIC